MINVNSKFNINDKAKVLWVEGINKDLYDEWRSGKDVWSTPLELAFMSMIGVEAVIREIEYYKVGDEEYFWYKARQKDSWVETRFEQSELELLVESGNQNVVLDNKFDVDQHVDIDFMDVFDDHITGSGTVVGLKAYIQKDSIDVQYLVSYDDKPKYKDYFPDHGLKNKV